MSLSKTMDPIAPPIPLDELLGHRAWVRALAHSLVRDGATADDLEQETWLAAMRRPPSDRTTVRGWFATVTRNLAREQGRTAGRRARREAAVARAEGAESTADVVARGESHRLVVQAVMDLDEPYRTTVLLRFFEELPPRDVAARMDCPVETVRTRTRRALAQLRERLGGDDDRREGTLRAALLPLLAAPADAAPRTRTGERTMLPLKIAAVAALLLAVPTAYVLLDPAGGGAPAGAPGDAGAPVVADAPPPRRVRVAPPPPAAGPADDDEGGGPAAKDDGWEVFPPETALPDDEDASVFANGRLAMRVSVDPPHPRAGEGFELVVTFRNDGTGPLRFHVPEHTGLVPFPRLELRGADGKVLLPVAASFQSMWQHGVQGEIVRLEPEEEREVRTRVGGVAEADPDPTGRDTSRSSRSQKRLALQPGDYAVTAILAKEKPVVPWGEPNFRSSEKEVPGLWTGEVRSTPISIRIAPPDEPMLTLRTPEKLIPGEDLVATLTVANPSQEEREIRGAFALRRSQKGGPSYVAWFAFGETARSSHPDHSRTLTLTAGEERSCRIDLGALRWTRVDRRRNAFHRGRWPFEREYPALWVTCGERDENGKGMLGSNTAFRALEPAPDLSASGLTLRVETDGLFSAEPFVMVRLRNEGAIDHVLPGTRAFHERVRLSLRLDRDGARPHELEIADSSLGATLVSREQRALRPGDEIVERVVLVDIHWTREVEPGRCELRAHWANADAGDREGFDVRPVVGRLMSEPVEILVPAR